MDIGAASGAQQPQGQWTTACAFAGKTRYLLSYIGCKCFYTFKYRGKLRGLFNLPEDPYNDFCVHCLFGSCAICQEYRELKNRGHDPFLGWSGNEQNMNKAIQVPPNVAPGMAR
ncbi:hypothetical protein K1719_000202 [Acacia pycnantha]|nr:hypothetical protein K1719_000202 [Acacia pycnantha]